MRSPLALVSALVLFLLTSPVIGATSAPAAAQVVAASARADSGSQLLVIMDVSGSMAREDASGTTLIDGARTAIGQLMDEVPGDAEIGLRLYGNTYAGDAQATGCVDTELAVPIGAASSTADQITAAIDAAEPTGFTPIGRSLTEAAGDFGTDVARSIVLVSDGEDTCGNPDPCVAAKRLVKKGIDVRIDTVGLFLQDDPAATRQLTCIAEATGGSYVGADDAASLATELSQVSTRAIQRFTIEGEPITGGPAQVSATPVEPGVTYVDDVVNGEAKWYSFEAEDGQRLTVTGTDDGSAEYGCCMTYTIQDSSGSRLAGDHGYSSGTANTYVADIDSDWQVKGGTYYVSVELDDTTGDDPYGEVPFQFTVEVADREVTASATPSETPSESASATETPSEAPSEAPAEADEPTAGTSPLLWGLVGILSVAVVGLGAAVIVLLRRTSTTRP